jgi:anti-anti-sigma regulatory factor
MPEQQILHTGSKATLILNENLIASIIPDLKNDIKRLLQAGVTALEIDLSNAAIVDSTGIGCLIATYNSLSKLGGSLTVTHLTADIYELFCSMRLNKHFTITASETDGGKA